MSSFIALWRGWFAGNRLLTDFVLVYKDAWSASPWIEGDVPRSLIMVSSKKAELSEVYGSPFWLDYLLDCIDFGRIL